MSKLEQELKDSLKAAMKARDLKTANYIRMVNTKIMERRTSSSFKGEVDDALVLEVIGAYKKTLDKAIVQYEGLGEKGAEQIGDLKQETEFLAQYLPKQMSEDDARKAVAEAVAEAGTTDPKMTGRITGMVMKKHKGVIDASLVKKLVGEALTG